MTKVKNIKDFFRRIHGEYEPIIKANNHSLGDMHNITIRDIDKENIAGRDIYFVVNQGGDRNSDINKFTAWFIDLDAGRNEDKSYKHELIVAIYKQDCLAKIRAFHPSLIVETRNGYHVYWLIKGAVSLKEWRDIEDKLVAKFDADKKAKSESKLLRVPFTNWMKDTDNPFFITVIEDNDVRYDVEMMKNELANVANASKIKTSRDVEFSGIHNKNFIYVYHKNISLIKARDINGLKTFLQLENIVFTSESECRDYLTKKINMADFLGISNPSSFNCIMHEDSHPSAVIYKGNSGDWIYYCHSKECGFVGNLIMVVAQLMDSGTGEAIEFIKAAYNIIVEVPAKIKMKQASLKENIRILSDNTIKDLYPDIHFAIRNYYQHLILLNTIAQDNIILSHDEKTILFFVSQKHMARILGAAQSKVSTRTALFALLELCVKVDDNDVPTRVYAKAKKHQAEKNVRDSIQFYSMPSYTWFSLSKINRKAKVYKENGGTMRGMSREWVYRTYGKEEADRVYPKRKGVEPTDVSNKFQKKFEASLKKSIDKKGYAKESEIVAKMEGWKGMNEIRSKRVLAESLKNLSLKRVRANKALKEKYKIKGNGYPFIIIRDY